MQPYFFPPPLQIAVNLWVKMAFFQNNFWVSVLIELLELSQYNDGDYAEGHMPTMDTLIRLIYLDL